ncbi:PAS domain S-box protein [Natrinema halophilum]|uniref:histidine kinase n=1 Tax=Natrinema halophilum TaxID=1699371 RepID=A0A7D5GT86_9EURY|nr:PAS domain S-box protein [Natrinema halophilum]QLG49909.1 PAS domain S-box protein [Natrinema halophilum]
MFVAVASVGVLADATAEMFAILSSVVGIVSMIGAIVELAIEIPILNRVAIGGPLGPGTSLILIGLAARSGSDRATAIERLTGDLRQFVSRLDGDAPVRGTETAETSETADRLENVDEPIDFTLDRDDEVGRLSEAIDDLATAVRDRERRRTENERYRQQLSRITSDPSLGCEATIRRLLELGCDRLEVETGFISRFDESTDRYEIETAVGQATDREGTTMDLSETALDESLESDDVLTVSDAAEMGTETLLASTDAEIHCYACDTIGVEGDLYGALCFTNRQPRDAPFTPDETSFVDLVARCISQTIERRSHIQAIRERERRLERAREFTDDMLDAVNDVVYLLDEDGEVRRWNQSLCEATGYSNDDIESMHALDFFDEADHDRVMDAIGEVLESGNARIDVPLVTSDGKRIPYQFTGSCLENPDGDRVIAGVGRDVSERQAKERRLREREARLERTTHMFKQAQRQAKVGAWELDVSEEPFELQWSSEICRIHGVPSDEDIDLDQAIDFYHPDDRPKIREAVERAIEHGETFDLELRIITADGDLRWVRTIGDPFRDGGEGDGLSDGWSGTDDGAVVKVFGAFQDITERKERERELERAETIIQALDEMVYTLDAEGRFRFLNDATASILGYEPEELIGEHVSVVMSSDPLEITRDRIRELLRSSELSRTFETHLKTDGGDVIDVENHMALLPMSDGEFAGTAGVIRDITERKEHERELERTTELLKQAERLAGIGGWELVESGDLRDLTLTDGLRRLADVPPDADIDFERASQFPHPDDREWVIETIESALVDGESYEIEHRLQTEQGNVRWVRSIGEPLRADGEGRSSRNEGGSETDAAAGIRGTIQDITAHKEHELALEALHSGARELLGTDSDREAAELVVETAADILEATGVAVYRLDPDVNRLDPLAYTDGFETLSDGAPSVDVGDTDAVFWNTYVSGTRTEVDDPETFDRSRVFGPTVESGVVVPIGDHGLFAVASGENPIDDEARQLIETLAATTEAAFDRIESEASLLEREAELEDRNRRLNRQMATTELIRRIDQLLIGADSQEEIERTVPERLVEADDIAFAWIGSLESSGTHLVPRTWAGEGQEYLDDVSLSYDASTEPAARTARTETPTVVPNVVEGLQNEPWRRDALDREFQSVISVPLSYAEYTYGVLTMYATEPDAFADLERSVVTELGEGIANAITAVKTREALHAETVIELTLQIDESTDLLSRIAAMTGAHVEYDGLGTHTADETLLFFATSGIPPDEVRSALEEIVSVTDYRLISDADDDCRFEVSVSGDTIASRLVRHGGSPRSMHADGDRIEVTVDVPMGTDVREFVEMLREQHAPVELQGRRHVERSMGTRSELVTTLFDALTDRQLEVLRTAYFAGFFDWPRETNGEELADMLEVTQPTVNRHLRIGQQRLLAQLFETDPLSSAGTS